MFENTETVHLRFNKIEHLKMEKDDAEIALVKAELELNPLTPALAADLSGYMRTVLFTKQDAEVTPQLHGATFNLSPLPQEIAVYAAPDQDEPSFTIQEAKIGHFHARRSKKSSTWRLVFSITFAPQSEHQLSQVVDCYTKQRVCAFADASPDLFSETGKERRKVAKAQRAAGIGVGASAAVN